MSFVKNWKYDANGLPVVDAKEGDPHYRAQADIVFVEVAKANRANSKIREFAVVGTPSAKATTEYPELATLEKVADVNHFYETHSDLVVFRVDYRGEGRIMGHTDPRK